MKSHLLLSIAGAGSGAALVLLGTGRPTGPSAFLAAEVTGRAAGPSTPPVAFVPNEGQWDPRALFVARTAQGTVVLEEQGFLLAGPEGETVRMRFVGAAAAERVGDRRLAGHHDYFLGNDPARWRTEVPLYASIRYRGLYPGADLVCYEREGRFEYDLALAAGADLGRIEVAVEGAEDLRVEEDGALSVRTSRGSLRQARPPTYEVGAAGERRDLEARYELRGPRRFGFAVRGWSRDRDLVLDPGIAWSTFVGGSEQDEPSGLRVDASGVVTIAGRTRSANYPVSPGAWDPTYGGASTGYPWDAFVTRLDPSLPAAAQLLFSTYVGGTLDDSALGLAVDASGIVTLAGQTGSGNFPVTAGAWDTTPGGGDGFLLRLDPSLPGPAQLLYSTFVGGSGYDSCEAVSVDAAGVVTIAGLAYSSDYPATAGASDTTFNGGSDVFVTRLDPSLPAPSQLLYSTFLGGTFLDSPSALSVDAAGVVTIAGRTASSSLSFNDFPATAGAWDTTFNGGSDAFVARLDPTLPSPQQLVYATYLGGLGGDQATALDVDASGAVTIAGVTTFTDFPTTPNAWDTTGDGGDAFFARLDPSLPASAQLVYSTFLGGSGFYGDSAHGLSVDASGVVTLAGHTSSSDYPTTAGAWDNTLNDTVGLGDAFVTRLQPSLPSAQQLLYSTFVGGGFTERAVALSVDAAGVATIAGHTGASDYPTTAGAWDPVYNGVRDAFVTRLDMLPTGASGYGTSTPGCLGPLPIGANSMPQVGNGAFAVTCSGAPAVSLGFLGLSGAAPGSPLSLFGIAAWIDPSPSAFLGAVPAFSDGSGFAFVPLPIPNLPALAGLRAFSQFLWADPCGPAGFSASSALALSVQP